MGLVHTPRVIVSVIKGLYQRNVKTLPMLGIGPSNPHIYTSRAGMFDVDYLGHMNNAAYLQHAELARWEWTAECGLLQGMVKAKSAYIVTGAAVRYRREVKPLFRKFEVHSRLLAIDDKDLWIYQTFRHAMKDDYKIRGQVLIKGAVIRGRERLDPREFLKNDCGLDADLLDIITDDGSGEKFGEEIMYYKQMETSLQRSASGDDKIVDEKV